MTNKACGLPAPAMAMSGTSGELGAGCADGTSSPFQQRDTNKDGKLTREELPAALFARLDANKDGTVTKAELAALW